MGNRHTKSRHTKRKRGRQERRRRRRRRHDQEGGDRAKLLSAARQFVFSETKNERKKVWPGSAVNRGRKQLSRKKRRGGAQGALSGGKRWRKGSAERRATTCVCVCARTLKRGGGQHVPLAASTR